MLLPRPFGAGERMRLVVNSEQLLERQVGVALGGAEARVTQKLLDRAQIGSAFEHVRRARVAQRMRVQVGAPGRERSVAAHQLLYPAHAETPATPAQQQRARIE